MIFALVVLFTGGCAARLTPQQEQVYRAVAVCRDKTGLPVQLLSGPDDAGRFRYQTSDGGKGAIDACFREQGLRLGGDPEFGEKRQVTPPIQAPKGPTVLGILAERPVLKIGDRWLRSDGTLELVSKDASGYVLQVGPKVYSFTTDGALREISINGIIVVRYPPPFPLLSWPLAVGRAWSYQGHLTNRLTGFDGPVQESLLVQRFEEIAVQAGVLRAFRIDTTTSTYWYSPEERTIVRRIPKRRNAPLLEEFELASLLVSSDRPSVIPPAAPSSPAPGTVENQTLRPREVAQHALPSVVSLVGATNGEQHLKFGSRFFVAGDLVVTNYHVIEGADVVLVKPVRRGAIYEVVGVIVADSGLDLALLKVRGGQEKPLQLAPTSPSIGDEIYVAGTPQGDWGLEGTFVSGVVSGLRHDGKRRLLQSTAPISQGSSAVDRASSLGPPSPN